MTRLTLGQAAIIAVTLLIARPAVAGYSVDVYIDGVFSYAVLDNAAGDSNPAVGDIEHHFLLTDVANRWQAEGDVLALGGFDGVPPVSTVVTDTLIEKIANVPIFSGELDFIHHYAASGLQSHSASIDGVFDNTVNHEVGGTSLLYQASVTGYDLGTFATGIYSGPGPHPFMGGVGPVVTPTTIEHHMHMQFYLDTLGDSIELFNSAEIHTVPEPVGLGLILMAAAAWSARRGRA